MKASKTPITSMILVALLGLSIFTFSTPNDSKMENDTQEMIGLLVTMTAKPGKEQDVRDFLFGGLSLVNDEPGTASWYAFQIDESTFGIFDTFNDEVGRQQHLTGEVAKVLMANAGDLLVDFDVNVSIQPIDLLATKRSKGEENKGLLVMMKAQNGKSKEVERFLLAGKELVNEEPATLSWYAIQIDDNTYAIFDTFNSAEGREAHLNGKVAAALMENAPVILEGFQSDAIQAIDLLASK